jgi:bifunctional ADP-heptose synthase (sugar kinase/adenylyltransferase)
MTVQQRKFKVLLIGDACLDYYVFVDATRQNPENDSPLYTEVDRLAAGGMGRHVYKCLTNLGIEVTAKFPEAQSEKVRIIDHKTGQHYCRFDKDQLVEPLRVPLYLDLEEFDAIVITDYNKGFVATETIQYIMDATTKPIFLDTKKRNLEDFTRCFIKINEKEGILADSIPGGTVVTMGNLGAMLVDNFLDYNYPALKVNAVDTCGAGDAFLAGYVYGCLKTDDIDTAIELGIVNSGISVSKVATYAPSLAELLEGMDQYDQQYGED